MTYRSNLLPQLKEAQEGKRMNEVGSFALAHSLYRADGVDGPQEMERS